MTPRRLYFSLLLVAASRSMLAEGEPGRSRDKGPAADQPSVLVLATGQTTKPPLDESGTDTSHQSLDTSGTTLHVDPKLLINRSNDLVKVHEPEMNASEQALYEKVAPILAKRPAFALKLLKAMGTQGAEAGAKPSPAYQFMLANAYQLAGHSEEAEPLYRSVVEACPEFLRAWNNLGVLCYSQDRYAEAGSCFSHSVSLGDRDPTTFSLLGTCFEKIGNMVSAERAYMQALATEPGKIDCTEGLLRLYLADKQYAKAETLVCSLLHDHPKEERYYLTYANLLLSMNRREEATALLQRMEDRGLAGQTDLDLLADLYVEQRLVPEALLIFKRVEGAQPLYVEQKLLDLSKSLIAERRWDQGNQVLLELEKRELSASGRLSCLEQRVDLEIGRHRWEAAKAQLEDLLKASPDNGHAWFGLGRVYLADLETAKAVEAFEKAYAIPESSYRASIELANIELKNRRYERSLSYVEHALSLKSTPSLETFRLQLRHLVNPELPVAR